MEKSLETKAFCIKKERKEERMKMPKAILYGIWGAF